MLGAGGCYKDFFQGILKTNNQSVQHRAYISRPLSSLPRTMLFRINVGNFREKSFDEDARNRIYVIFAGSCWVLATDILTNVSLNSYGK
jgi:hypothetical protein